MLLHPDRRRRSCPSSTSTLTRAPTTSTSKACTAQPSSMASPCSSAVSAAARPATAAASALSPGPPAAAAVDLPSQALGTVQYPAITNARLQVRRGRGGVCMSRRGEWPSRLLPLRALPPGGTGLAGRRLSQRRLALRHLPDGPPLRRARPRALPRRHLDDGVPARRRQPLWRGPVLPLRRVPRGHRRAVGGPHRLRGRRRLHERDAAQHDGARRRRAATGVCGSRSPVISLLQM